MTLLALALAPSLALAQDDRAAGLFTEARQLPLVSQSMTVDVSATEARVHLVQVFSNPGDAVGQADYRLALPEGGAVDGFAFWTDGRRLEAALQEAGAAEAKHHEAAASGRETALMKDDHGVTTFSVYPVPAGGLKQVEVDLRLPVVREGGRSHVALPVDRFLGQPGADTSAMVTVTPAAPLADWGVEGADVVPLRQGADGLRLALSGDQPVDVWWAEDGPPLQLTARSVEVDEGVAVEVLVALNDAGPDAGGWERVEVVVDGSASVARRGKGLRALVERMQRSSTKPLRFHAAGANGRVGIDGRDVVAGLRDGAAGHTASWGDLSRALEDLDCSAAVRCVVVTDAQLGDLPAAEQSAHPLLVLADAHERDFFGKELPARAMLWDDADGVTAMQSVADRLVRPTLGYEPPRMDGGVLHVLDETERALPEGGLARHFALVDTVGERVSLAGVVNTAGVELSVDLERVDPGSDAGRQLRRGYYRSKLAQMMREWKQTRTDDIKAEITALSLREDIPTAFTSLQVDDPELSLVAIKPGDPILTVHPEAGLTDVVAWYPFGETRRLVRDAASGDFTDRFLVPRFWDERAYRVEIVKRFADGSTKQEHTWYVLDEAAPGARLDLVDGALVVDTGEDTPEVSRVHVEAGGRTWLLPEPAAGATAWTLDLDAVPAAFTVVIRDRAGNRASFPARVEAGELVVEGGARADLAGVDLPATGAWSVEAAGANRLADLSWHAGLLTAEVDGRVWTATTPMDSLVATAVRVEGEVLWLGTRAGELLRLEGGDVTRIDLDAPEHPVTGLARLRDGALLVGVLGEGLVEVEGTTVRKTRFDVGSRFITGVAPDGDDVVVATAYNGLWRVVGGRAFKSRLGDDLVTGLVEGDGGLTVLAGSGAVRRLGRDRFTPVDDGNGLPVGAPDLMGAARLGDRTLVAGFDSGLLELRADGALVELPVDLGGPSTRRVNAVAVWEDLVWVATEGGLFVLDRELGAHWRVVDHAVHGLATSPDGLAMATTGGLFLLDRDGDLSRRDTGEVTGKWMSVAFHDGALWAGNMEGVARFSGEGDAWLTADQGFTANWATALLSDGDALLVGTYSDGLWTVDASGAAPVPGLEGQWVPPSALARIGGDLWVGGLGMDPVVVTDAGAWTVPTPARDTNAFLADGEGGAWAFTSDGLLRVRPAAVAAR